LKLSTYTRDKLGGVLLDGLPSAIAKAMPEGAVVKFGKQGHWYVRADVTDKVDGLLADSEFIRGYEKHLTGMKAYAAGKRIGRTEIQPSKSKLSAERLVDTLDAIDGKLSRVATMLDAVVSDSREQKVAIETLTARVARLEREVEKLRESERVEVSMDPAVIQRPSFFGLFRRVG
jgi:hypothetical protein